MRLIDVDTLRKQWNVSEKCEDCKQDARYCGGDLYGSELYSLRDICESIDDVPIIEAIPIEWLQNVHKNSILTRDDIEFRDWLIEKWKKEQENQK